MKVALLYLLLLACAATFAYCWISGWGRLRRGIRDGCLACALGCFAAAVMGASLPALLGVDTRLSASFYAVMVFAYGLGFVRPAFVLRARRLVRQGRRLGPFWATVYDYEAGDSQATPSTPAELISSEAPDGRGTEPEASVAPAGRGSELEPAVSAAAREADAEGSATISADRGRTKG